MFIQQVTLFLMLSYIPAKPQAQTSPNSAWVCFTVRLNHKGFVSRQNDEYTALQVSLCILV